MRFRAFTLGAIGAAVWLALHVGQAEEAQKAGPAQPDSVQQQLDDLKAGQQRLSRQLEEIKELLQQGKSPAPAPVQGSVPNVVSANVHGEPYRGTNTATVAVIEYSDFDCTFCGKYARTIFPRVDQEYIRTGKIRYFFRDLPEPHETNSWFKARAARCAGDQGKFWELHDLLFATQGSTEPQVIAMAQGLGLDMEAFNACLSSEKYLFNIQSSADGAKRMGLYGTPAFLIGKLTEDGDFVRVKKVQIGAESYETLKDILDAVLAGKEPK